MSPYSKSTPRIRLVVDWGELVVDAGETFEEGPVRIMDSREQVLRSKTEAGEGVVTAPSSGGGYMGVR